MEIRCEPCSQPEHCVYRNKAKVMNRESAFQKQGKPKPGQRLDPAGDAGLQFIGCVEMLRVLGRMEFVNSGWWEAQCCQEIAIQCSNGFALTDVSVHEREIGDA
jgi:hypothetical protein